MTGLNKEYCVYREVRTEYSNAIQVNFVLQMFKTYNRVFGHVIIFIIGLLCDLRQQFVSLLF